MGDSVNMENENSELERQEEVQEIGERIKKLKLYTGLSVAFTAGLTLLGLHDISKKFDGVTLLLFTNAGLGLCNTVLYFKEIKQLNNDAKVLKKA